MLAENLFFEAPAESNSKALTVARITGFDDSGRVMYEMEDSERGSVHRKSTKLLDAKHMHPAGYCEHTEAKFMAPATAESSDFNWSLFLIDRDAQPVPAEFFNQVCCCV